MEIIESGRRTGKTETLVRWMLVGQPHPGQPNSWDRTILVATRQRADELRDRLRKALKVPAEAWNTDSQEYLRWCAMSANVEVVADVLAGRQRKLGGIYHPGTYVIDDLDDVLAAVFGNVPVIITRRPDEDR